MRKQCATCPWRVGVDPTKIPDGYCATQHAALSVTIAQPGARLTSGLRIMACHKSPRGNEFPCVGWLANQLGPGNNIGLRLAAMAEPDLLQWQTVGEQYAHFAQTLPRAVTDDV